jgi:cell division protein FtsI/penicillin-binding protein 2
MQSNTLKLWLSTILPIGYYLLLKGINWVVNTVFHTHTLAHLMFPPIFLIGLFLWLAQRAPMKYSTLQASQKHSLFKTAFHALTPLGVGCIWGACIVGTLGILDWQSILIFFSLAIASRHTFLGKAFALNFTFAATYVVSVLFFARVASNVPDTQGLWLAILSVAVLIITLREVVDSNNKTLITYCSGMLGAIAVLLAIQHSDGALHQSMWNSLFGDLSESQVHSGVVKVLRTIDSAELWEASTAKKMGTLQPISPTPIYGLTSLMNNFGIAPAIGVALSICFGLMILATWFRSKMKITTTGDSTGDKAPAGNFAKIGFSAAIFLLLAGILNILANTGIIRHGASPGLVFVTQSVLLFCMMALAIYCAWRVKKDSENLETTRYFNLTFLPVAATSILAAVVSTGIHQFKSHPIRQANALPARANILAVDGTVIATNKPAIALWIDISQLPWPNEKQGQENAERISKQLQIIFKDDDNDLLSTMVVDSFFNGLERSKKGEIDNFKIANALPTSYVEKLVAAKERLGIENGANALRWTKYMHRHYPQGALFSHVVGIATLSDDQNGLDGLELELDGRLRSPLKGVETDLYTRVLDLPVRTSLSVPIQEQASASLKKAMKQHSATAGAAIVANAKTGEVLAMVSAPRFDAKERTTYHPEKYYNHATANLFPMGSLMAPLVAGASIENGKTGIDSVIATGSEGLKVAGVSIKDFRASKSLTVGEIVAKSSEVGLAKISLNLSSKNLLDFFSNARLTQRPDYLGMNVLQGSEINNAKLEQPEYLVQMGNLSNRSLAQMLNSYLAIAAVSNEGSCPDNLRLVSYVDAASSYRPAPCEISAATSKSIREMLAKSVSFEGTAPRASVVGMNVGGKTATVWIPAKTDSSNDKPIKIPGRDIAAFIGLAPIEAPEIAVAVMLQFDSGKGKLAGDSVAPLFSEIVGASVKALNKQTSNK